MWKESWRDKISTFFSIAFPVMFLLIFGFLFGGSGNSVKTAVVTVDYDLSDFGDVYTSLEELKGYYHEVAVVGEEKNNFFKKTTGE